MFKNLIFHVGSVYILNTKRIKAVDGSGKKLFLFTFQLIDLCDWQYDRKNPVGKFSHDKIMAAFFKNFISCEA